MLTVLLVAVVGITLLELPLGAAILLGAILAPTDPVLASDVRLEHSCDTDRVRFSLTAEAGLNEGITFPFVLLGLGLLGRHDLGDGGWRWLALNTVWAVAGGLSLGWLLGSSIASFVLYLRRVHGEAVGLDDFLALGLIALSYGAGVLLHASGVLAVFTAGLALRRTERKAAGDQHVREVPAAPQLRAEEAATDPATAPAYMAETVLVFHEQLERMGEVAVMLLIGGMLTLRFLTAEALGFALLLFFGLRPLAVGLCLLGTRTTQAQRGLIAWFGIRGVGSIFYLAYGIAQGLPSGLAGGLTALTLTTVALSVTLHGVTVTPLMRWYERRMGITSG